MTDLSTFRKLSKEEINEIIRKNDLWVRTDGREGSPADLSRTNLRGVSLVGSNLEGANLEGAYLYGAYLKKINLRGAILSGSNLRGANLRWADLRRSIFKDTNLMRADLMKADLRGTFLAGAINLDCEQLFSAVIDLNTQLPIYLEVNWIGQETYECKKVARGI